MTAVPTKNHQRFLVDGGEYFYADPGADENSDKGRPESFDHCTAALGLGELPEVGDDYRDGHDGNCRLRRQNLGHHGHGQQRCADAERTLDETTAGECEKAPGNHPGGVFGEQG